MLPVTAVDERRHEPGAHRLWGEAWYVDFSQADPTDRGDANGVLGGFVRLGLYPNLGRAWWWAYLATSEGLVVVRDHDVPLPRASALEVRSEGLWGELTCETPLEHWSFGMEAFGLVIEDPLEALQPGGEIGKRVPVGLDLEWEAIGPPFEHPHANQPRGRYQHAGRVRGEFLVGEERIAIDGMGERDHSWGELDWWRSPWHWSAFQGRGEDRLVWSRGQARLLAPGSEYGTGYVALHDGDPHPVGRADVQTEHWAGAGGLPRRATYRLADGTELGVEVVTPVPIRLEPPDAGRPARLTRALCRFATPEGDGLGWAEWLEI
jgi:hypothetical protein